MGERSVCIDSGGLDIGSSAMHMQVLPNPAVAHHTTAAYRFVSSLLPGKHWGMLIAGIVLLTLMLFGLSIGQELYLAHTFHQHPHSQQWSAACDGAPLPC
jgi:hypothetical protein